MKLQLQKYYWNTWSPPPPISYSTTGKTPAYKLDSLKVDVKTKPGERDSDTVTIYVLLFWTGIPEALLKFVTILHRIIRGQDLFTGSQKFGMTWNLVFGEALRLFKQKARDRGTETNANY